MRRINAALEELVGDIINADGTFQFDDTNQTDLPRGTGTLVEGQQTYTFASEYLQITMIEVKDSNGNWYKLKPLDQDDLGDRSPDEYFGLTSGSPTKGAVEFFDQLGDTIFLYPSPTSTSVTLSGGIRIWFKRTVDLFTTADTTQSPGLPSTHHILLAYMAALPYNAVYHPDRIPWLVKKIGSNDPRDPHYGGMRKSLIEHYAHREKTKRHVMKHKKIQHI